ncbi:MAG: hypothetical protein P1U30_11270, partial [Phycisphaerales bacterium]|nr:hypothetical protein [Phycisphaerales bacterium]
HYHMVRDEDFDKAASTPAYWSEEKSVAKSVAKLSHNASQQQAALNSIVQQNQALKKQGSAFMPIPADRCCSLQNSVYGPGGT